MAKQIDRAELRRTIEAAAAGDNAAVVSREWLEQLQRELAELDSRRAAAGDRK